MTASLDLPPVDPRALTRERIAGDLLGLVVGIDSVFEHPLNPNEGDPDSIGESLEEFTQYKPIVIQASTRYIIAGNHTHRGAKARGWRWIAAVVLDCDDAQAQAILVGDNRHAEKSRRDPDKLAPLLEELMAANRLTGTGYSPTNVDALLAELRGAAPDPNSSGTELPAPPKPRPSYPLVTRPGDLWTLGEHRVMCGDAREQRDVSQLLGGSSPQIIITSPPYADRREYDERSPFRPVHPDQYLAWFDAIAESVVSYLRPDGGFFLNIRAHTDQGQRELYVMKLIIHLVEKHGLRLVDDLCWHNTREGIPGGYKDRFKNAWEPIYHLALNKAIKFRPENVMIASESAFRYESFSTAGSGSGINLGNHRTESGGLARPSNVLEFAAETRQGEHTAPFPVALPDFFIRAFSDPGNVIYDPFGGSGTTLEAGERALAPDGQSAKRRVRLMEISPAYCDLTLRRAIRLTGEDPIRQDGRYYSDLFVECGGSSAVLDQILSGEADEDDDLFADSPEV